MAFFVAMSISGGSVLVWSKYVLGPPNSTCNSGGVTGTVVRVITSNDCINSYPMWPVENSNSINEVSN